MEMARDDVRGRVLLAGEGEWPPSSIFPTLFRLFVLTLKGSTTIEL